MDQEKALIKIGDYVVIQKQKYFRLHQLNAKCDVVLGKDKVNLKGILGLPFWTTFKMVPKNKREFDLEVAEQVDSLPETVMKDVTSGSDNRNITDDGKSQLLTTEEIVAFRDSGLSAQNIVGKLIESSTTFKNKTEYSQEKYLKKKEKKYFEFIVVRPPTMRLLADVYFNKDQSSVLGLRHDTIAQILSYANVQSDGTYLLFENGTQALVGAAILDCLAEGGSLINLSPGKSPAKQAILGMNFAQEKINRFMNVRLIDFVSALEGKSGDDVPAKSNGLQVVSNSTASEANIVKTSKCSSTNGEPARQISEDPTELIPTKLEDPPVTRDSKKRKIESNETPAKKAKWMETLETTVDLLKTKKADGLIIACKEYPLGILSKFLHHLKPSRQIVVYSLYREPLVKLYTELKSTRKDVINLHLYENWLRNHQVLTDRTHPEVNMSTSGGHILVGTKVSLSTS